MKFLHTADLHLGKALGRCSLVEDQRFILQQLVDLAASRGVEAVLIAGDVYDRSVPPAHAVDLLDEFLVKLAQRHIAVVMVAGNHDDPVRLGFANRLLQGQRVHIAGEYDGTVPRVAMGGVNVCLLPFVRAKTVAYFHPDDGVQTQTEAVRVALAHADLDANAVNVLVTHQFVSLDPARSIVGNVESVDASVFDGFRYVALGHLHTMQQLGDRPIYYVGSPLMYSQTDLKQRDNARRVNIVTINEDGAAHVEAVPLKPLRNVRALKGTLAELRDHAVDTNDYVFATLTDETPILDVMAQLQTVYPRALSVSYERPDAPGGGGDEAGSARSVKGKTLAQILADFYRLRIGGDISDEALRELRAVAEDCGVSAP